jgi:hypothetical protein
MYSFSTRTIGSAVPSPLLANSMVAMDTEILASLAYISWLYTIRWSVAMS